MYKVVLKVKFLLLLFISWGVIAKPLLIQITGGKNIGVPIAITNFASALPLDLAAIIRNDLQNSGQFRVLSNSAMPTMLPVSMETLHEQNWRELELEYLTLGSLHKNDTGSYDFKFQLIDLYKSSHTPALSLYFKNIKQEQLRNLAHHLSDKIFKKIIGVKGFFSTKLAYITVEEQRKEKQYSLTVADADGFNDQQVVTTNYPLMSPAWSPDGKEIAFVSFKNHRASIEIVTLATGKTRTITSSPGINGAPAWSPDGKSIAVVLSKEGSPKIYVINLESKKINKVTRGDGIDTEPCWDKDGRSLVFTSNRGGKPQIYRLMLDTGKVKRLTFNGGYNTTPSLTADGKKLVMLHKNTVGFNVAVQDLANSKLKVLTNEKLGESPSIAPNGMMVLYGSLENDKYVLKAVSLDGRFRMLLPISEANVKEPVWSPYLN